MKITKIILTIIITTILTYIFFYLPASSKNDNEFIVGTSAGYAPWVSINPEGEYEGFDIDFANKLAQEINKKLILKDLGNMTSLFTALDQGKIDAIIWGMAITKDRLKKVAMVNYQGELISSYPLIFWKTIPQEIKNIKDLAGKTVCAEPTSHQEEILQKYCTSVISLPTDKIDDALLNIQYAKADAAIVEPAIAKKFKTKYPEIQILNVDLDPQDQISGVGVIIKKNNESLINQVSQAIEVLKKNNFIKQLEQKWNMIS